MTDTAVRVPAPFLHLEVACGAQCGRRLPVSSFQVLIGRSKRCQLRANSDTLGEFHCVVLTRLGRVFLRDLNSESGTLLNGRQVFGEVEIRDGDRLQAGPLCFVARLGEQEPAETVPTLAEAAEPLEEANPPCAVLEVQPWGVLAAAEPTGVIPDAAALAEEILERYRKSRRRFR